VARYTPRLSAAWARGQPSSVMCCTSSPAELGQAGIGQVGISIGHEVPSRLGAQTAQGDRGDPRLSTAMIPVVVAARV
jgi:hypothetical protein